MKITKKIMFLLLLCLLSLGLVGCNEKQGESSNVITFKDTTIYGFIEEINDNSIVLSVGNLISIGNNQGGMVDPNQNSGDQPITPDGETNEGETNPPELPGGETNGGETNPPELPDGETSEGETNPPELPDGEKNSEQGSQNEEGNELNQFESLELSYFYKSTTQAIIVIVDESLIYDAYDNVIGLSGLSKENIIQITIDSNSIITKIQIIEVSLYDENNINQGGENNPGGGDIPGGQEEASGTYSSITTYDSDTTIIGETYTSTGTDENAILVQNEANVVLTNITLTRNSNSSTGGDNSSFYGVGAGLLVISGTAYIDGGTFNTDSKGGAGVFSYATGVVYIAGSTIDTKESTSGGIHVAGGGTLYAWDLTVTTAGESSAAIRSDRGGGTMVVDGGSYTSNGTGSPSVYCTADIAINDATLTANNSEAICIEGLNSLYIYNSSISGNMKDLSQNDTTWSIIVYQSMSGDSKVGNSTLHIVDSSIDAKNGGVFYTTNTECSILLENTNIITYEDTEYFLQCTGNTNSRGWGNAGSNGSDCLFTARKQTMNGDVIWDKASNLDFYVLDSSCLTGKIYDDETWAGNSTSGYCSVYIDATSKWVVTASSTVTNLYNKGTIVDNNGNLVTIVNTNGDTLVSGTSELIITVLGEYSTKLDVSNAISSSSFTDFAVEKPSELN